MRKLLSFAAIIYLIITLLSGCADTKQTTKSKSLSENKVIQLDDVYKTNVSFVYNSRIYLISSDGSRFEDVTPKSIKKNSNILDTYFIDRDNGVAIYGDIDNRAYVCKTNDGGKTWDLHTIGKQGYASNISFIDKNNGWILLHEDAAMHHEQVAVMQTKDGGLTWSVISEVNPQQFKTGDIPFSGNKSSMVFQDDKRGWITGFVPADNLLYLFATKDGGITWKDKSFYIDDEFKNSQAATMTPIFFSAEDGILPVRIYHEKRIYAFFITHDGGESWKYGSAIANTQSDNFVWSFYNNGNGYSTDGSDLYFIKSGSNKWVKVRTGMNFKNIQKLIFLNDKFGWIISNEGIYKTVDGGENWSKLNI